MKPGELHQSRGALALCKPTIIAAFLALILAAACDKAAAPAPAPQVVDIITVEQKDVPIYREWVGSLDGDINATIRPQVTGYLIKQNYREGDAVKKGQTLFEIDPRTFQTAVDQAKAARSQQQANYATAAANLARIKPLAEKNALSRKDLDDATGSELQARALLDQATAALDSAKLNLGFTRIVSPIDGIAGLAKAQIGDLLSPSATTELTTVSNVNPIKVYINISEREYLNFQATAGNRSKPEDIPLALILLDGSTYPKTGKSTRPPAPSRSARSSPTPTPACAPASSPRSAPPSPCTRTPCSSPSAPSPTSRANT